MLGMCLPELLRLASLKVERRGELFFFGKLQDLSCIQDCDKLSNKNRASSALNAVIYTFRDAKLPSQGEYARAFCPVAFSFVDCCHEVFCEDKKQLISASSPMPRNSQKRQKLFGAMLLHPVCCKVLVRGELVFYHELSVIQTC